MTAEQAKAAADMLATVWEGEFPATCQGTGSRQGRQPGLQAGCEVANSVGAGDTSGDRGHLVHRQHHQGCVRMEPRGCEAGRVAVQERGRRGGVLQAGVSRETRGAPRAARRQVDRDARLLRHDEDAAGAVHRLREQPQHPSPRSACRLSARDGLESAEHLRPQCGRGRSVRLSALGSRLWPEHRAQSPEPN